MQQVCSWCAHHHDTHVQEHALTHTGPALGGGNATSILWSAYALMWAWYQVLQLLQCQTVLPGPCVSVLVRVPVHAHACSRAQHTVCPSPGFWGVPVSICVSVCAARAWARLQGLGPGSAAALCVGVGLEPGVCGGHREPCPALPCPCWGCSTGGQSRHPACLRLPREGRWRRYRTVPGVFSS